MKDNKDLMQQMLDKHINVSGITQQLHPDWTSTDILRCINSHKDDYGNMWAPMNRDELAKEVYAFWKQHATEQFNESKNVKRINESQLRAIVAESVKNVLREGSDTSAYRDEAKEIAERLGWLASYLHNLSIVEQDDELYAEAEKASKARDIVKTILASRTYLLPHLRTSGRID